MKEATLIKILLIRIRIEYLFERIKTKIADIIQLYYVKGTIFEIILGRRYGLFGVNKYLGRIGFTLFNNTFYI